MKIANENENKGEFMAANSETGKKMAYIAWWIGYWWHWSSNEILGTVRHYSLLRHEGDIEDNDDNDDSCVGGIDININFPKRWNWY